MTPTTVRMVLVEGEMADGVTVDHDTFDVTETDDPATSGAASQVVDAILGTKESAASGGHYLKSIGVTWSDHAEASVLREALAARDIDDVMLVSEGHAAASLAQAVGRAVGYDTTALLFVDRDTATLSVVQTDDGSVVKVLSRTLHSDDAMAVLTEMAAAVDAHETPPQGMFVVGSGVEVTSVKEHLEHLVSIPVSAPDEPELALARGAALAAANAPAFEPSTVGLAYSLDPDGTTAGSLYAGLASAETQLAPGADAYLADVADYEPRTDFQLTEERKPFLLVGSALTSIFVVGVVALVISLAVSIRPTADQRPSPAESAIGPSTVVPAAPPVPEAAPVEEAPAPPPPAETIKAPVPVVQEARQAPPRTVYVEAPAPAPAPAAPPPAAPPPPPPPAAPPPAPVPAPAPPVYVPPPVYNPPPAWYPRKPWEPPWRPPRPTYYPPTPTWTPPKPTWTPPPPTWTPPPPTWTPPAPEPQYPQYPQVPSWQNGSGSSGPSGSERSGSSGSGSGRSGSDSGRYPGGSSGRGGSGGCFLIFCSSGN